MMDIANRSQYPSAPLLLPSMDVLQKNTATYALGPKGPTSNSATLLPPLPSSTTTRYIAGLQTPPPEMTSSQSYPHHSYQYDATQPKQFMSTLPNPTVAKITDPFRYTSTQPQTGCSSLQRLSSPLLRHEYTNQNPRRDDSTTHRSSPPMTVPSSVNSSKGNLQDFAAQIACLFWFESTFVLQRIAEAPANYANSPMPPLAPDAIPTSGFRKWVTTILSTTRVSQNVILLALLFIYRLKKLNPSVQGKAGSEFRLFTVALMLGNKFLDDNTYTNKTWAEVSGINVQEIHIMEVEFLSNMRYSLFVGEKEWQEWLPKLGKFWAYWERASKAPLDLISRPQPKPFSHFQTIPQPLPSPNTSPPYSHSRPPILPALPPLQYPTPSNLHPPYTAIPQPEFPTTRKRSFDYAAPSPTLDMPPAKRITRSQAPPKLAVAVPQYSVLNHYGTLPPLQPLEYSTAPPAAHSLPQPQPTALPTSQPMHLPLPVPGTRSFSTVYSQPPMTKPMTTVSVASSFTGSPYDPMSTHTHSPYSNPTSATTSPTTPAYNSQHSPAWYLERHSPYRPVRSVHTLLVPPVSQAPQPAQLSYDQMHYQTIAKTKQQYKTGPVPYMQSDMSWSPHSWLPNMQQTL